MKKSSKIRNVKDRIKKHAIYIQVIDLFCLLKKVKFSLALPVFFDIFFLLLFGFFTANIFAKIVENIQQLGIVAMQNSEQFGKALGSNSGLLDVFTLNEFSGIYIKNIIFSYLLLGLVVLVIYSFFQGISWRFCLNFCQEKKNRIGLFDYVKKFFLVNLFWLVPVAVYHFLSILVAFQTRMGKKFGVSGITVFGVVTFLVFLLLIYLMPLSYSLISNKKSVWQSFKNSFVLGFKNAKILVPVYLIIFLGFVVINQFMILLFMIHSITMYITGTLLLMPFISISRMFIISVVKDLINKD
ncbi:hypothetical protein ACFL0W_00365 [Nanoarchaeota archaeon]